MSPSSGLKTQTVSISETVAFAAESTRATTQKIMIMIMIIIITAAETSHFTRLWNFSEGGQHKARNVSPLFRRKFMLIQQKS
jgi:hypothetical protein